VIPPAQPGDPHDCQDGNRDTYSSHQAPFTQAHGMGEVVRNGPGPLVTGWPGLNVVTRIKAANANTATITATASHRNIRTSDLAGRRSR
jgi:hypothetical protein